MSLILSVFAINAYAVGIGSANVSSLLGEPLKISIPLHNVRDIASLSVDVTSDFLSAQSGETLQLLISREQRPALIEISTDWDVSEPWFKFVLQVKDQGSVVNKEFKVLIRTATERRIRSAWKISSDGSPGVSVPGNIKESANSNQTTKSLDQETLNASRSSRKPVELTNPPKSRNPDKSAAIVTQSKDILGPYQWAQTGKIPPTFGAVLQGQSLWRVARRINQAMGVSIEQMTLSLYIQNPDAFSSESVDSLQAGSYLQVPSQQAVTRYSKREAVAELKRLSKGLAISSRESLANDSADEVSDTTAGLQVNQVLAAPAITEDSESGSAAYFDSLVDSSNEGLSEQSATLKSEADITAGSKAKKNADVSPAFQLSTPEEPVAESSDTDQTEHAQGNSISSQQTSDETSREQALREKEAELKDLQIILLEQRILTLEESINRLAEGNSNRATGVLSSISKNQFGKGLPKVNMVWMWLLLPLPLIVLGMLFRNRLGLLKSTVFVDGKELKFENASLPTRVNEHADIAASVTVDDDFDFDDFDAFDAAEVVDAVEIVEIAEIEVNIVDDEIKIVDDESDDLPPESEPEAKPKPTVDPTKPVKYVDNSDFTVLTARTTRIAEAAKKASPTLVTKAKGGHDEESYLKLAGKYSELSFNSELEAADGISFDDPLSEVSELTIDFTPDGRPSVNSDKLAPDLDFELRVNRLLNEKDFEYAREMLDFARYNEISDYEYHFERLRLFFAMNDEDDFFQYYEEIEPNLEDYSEDLQNGIAELVAAFTPNE